MRRPIPLYTLILLLVCLGLAGCGSSQASEGTATPDFTRVFQTVEAMLTQTPGDSSSPTDSPAATHNPMTPTATSPRTLTPSLTPVPGSPTTTLICDKAEAGNPIDVTIPDDTVLRPGRAFTKVWKLQNAGSCTWTKDYAATFFYGEAMSAPEAVSLIQDVPPGQSIEIAVEFVAPEMPGTYQSNWKLRNPAEALFGIGPNGDAPFWVRIVVQEAETETPTPTFLPTFTPTPTPTLSPTPTATATPPILIGSTVLLPVGGVLDLDTAQLNPDEGGDLGYQADLTHYHWLFPMFESVIGVYGMEEPSLHVCQAAGMSAAPVAVESLSIGSYLCYRTDQGLVGWMRLAGVDAGDTALTLEILTWTQP
jgi:hypothetical protein